MKFLITGIAFVVLCSSAIAGDYSANRNWGVSPSGGSVAAKVVTMDNLATYAGHNRDAENGMLTANPTYNTYYNSSCGNCTNTTITGNNNTVSTNSSNTGHVNAQQGVGNGGITQGITQ